MTDVQLKRCLKSISKWYFIEFFNFFYAKTEYEQDYLLVNKTFLIEVMGEHYNSVKRVTNNGVNGFNYRCKGIIRILRENKMYYALVFIINNSRSKKIIADAQDAHEGKFGYRLV